VRDSNMIAHRQMVCGVFLWDRRSGRSTFHGRIQRIQLSMVA
jgi:hypothetical protein